MMNKLILLIFVVSGCASNKEANPSNLSSTYLQLLKKEDISVSYKNNDVPRSILQHMRKLSHNDDLTLLDAQDKLDSESLPKRRLIFLLEEGREIMLAYEYYGRSHRCILAYFKIKNNKIKYASSIALENLEPNFYHDKQKIMQAVELHNFLILYDNDKKTIKNFAKY
jgi:hypothetical protein